MTTEAKPELPAHPDWITQATVTGRAHATCERGAECRAEKNPAATLGRCLLLTFPFIEPNERPLAAETENVPLKSPEELKGFEFNLLARHRNQWPQGTRLFEGLYHFR